MKKLKKLKLKKHSKLQDLKLNEMSHFKGGANWSSEFNSYLLDEVNVIGSRYPNNIFGCPQCPRYGSGPGSPSGDASTIGYRYGVAIRHWFYH